MALVLGATQATAELFEDIALILVVPVLAGLVATWLRQSLVVAFIAVGVFVGPSMLGCRRWVVSTIRHTDTNLALLHSLRHHGYRGRIAVASHYDTDAGRLEEAGADRVLLPYASAAAEVVELVAPR